MKSTHTIGGRAIGSCTACGAGIAYEGVDSGTATKCPNCGARVRLSFVYGNKSAIPCDGRCMGAVSRYCSCSCGGVNHARWFLPIELVPVWERDKAKAVQAKRVQDFTKRIARKRQAKEDQQRESREAILTGHPTLAMLLDDEWFDNHFLRDMRSALESGLMTERQIAAAERTITRISEQAKRRTAIEAEKAAVKASGAEVVEGRRLVEGEIVSYRQDEVQYGYNTQYVLKGLIKQADGTKLWGTLPKDLFWSEHEFIQTDVYATWLENLRGRQVRMTARVQRSKDDPTFGFYSRPTKAEFVK